MHIKSFLSLHHSPNWFKLIYTNRIDPNLIFMWFHFDVIQITLRAIKTSQTNQLLSLCCHTQSQNSHPSFLWFPPFNRFRSPCHASNNRHSSTMQFSSGCEIRSASYNAERMHIEFGTVAYAIGCDLETAWAIWAIPGPCDGMATIHNPQFDSSRSRGKQIERRCTRDFFKTLSACIECEEQRFYVHSSAGLITLFSSQTDLICVPF